MTTSSNKTKLIIALGLVYIIWGSTYLGMKIGTETVPPFLLSAMRFILSGTIMLGFGLWREKEKTTPRQWLNAALIGILLIGIGNSSVALSVKHMPSGLVALFIAALPAWFIVLDWAFFSKQRPKPMTLWGLVIGFVGLFYIFDPFHLFSESAANGVRPYPLWPIPVLTVGSIAWATGSLLSPRLDTPRQLTSSGIQMLAGMVSSIILSYFLERNDWHSIDTMTVRAWSAILYLVIFGSLIGYTAYSWLVNNAPPHLTATYAYVNPVVAIFLGWLIVDEVLTLQSIIGSVIVIGGVILMTAGKRKH